MSRAIGAATWLGHASSKRRAASSASSLEPKKNPASAVTTIRNGKSAISVDRAIWLAIAQPSSAMKRWNASTESRNDRFRRRNVGSREAAIIKSSIALGFARPSQGRPVCLAEREESGGVDVAEELA